jgi:hypothetical protein
MKGTLPRRLRGDAPEPPASDVCVWLHEDSLGAGDAALMKYPQAPVIFVFDEAHLTERRVTFKRLFFVYECVTDLFERIGNPVKEIHRGDVVAEVTAFCRAHGLRRIAVTATYAPHYAKLTADLARAGFSIEEFPKPKLAQYHGPTPGRFMTFWKRIERAAFQD